MTVYCLFKSKVEPISGAYYWTLLVGLYENHQDALDRRGFWESSGMTDEFGNLYHWEVEEWEVE